MSHILKIKSKLKFSLMTHFITVGLLFTTSEEIATHAKIPVLIEQSRRLDSKFKPAVIVSM